MLSISEYIHKHANPKKKTRLRITYLESYHETDATILDFFLEEMALDLALVPKAIERIDPNGRRYDEYEVWKSGNSSKARNSSL